MHRDFAIHQWQLFNEIDIRYLLTLAMYTLAN